MRHVFVTPVQLRPRRRQAGWCSSGWTQRGRSVQAAQQLWANAAATTAQPSWRSTFPSFTGIVGVCFAGRSNTSSESVLDSGPALHSCGDVDVHAVTIEPIVSHHTVYGCTVMVRSIASRKWEFPCRSSWLPVYKRPGGSVLKNMDAPGKRVFEWQIYEQGKRLQQLVQAEVSVRIKLPLRVLKWP